MANVIDILVHTSGDASRVFTEMQAGADSLTSKFTALGKVGGLALLAVGAVSVKMAADFQTAVTRLAGGANEADSNLKMMSDGMLKMSGQVGFSALELAKAQYQISSSGYHGADGLNVLRAAAEGAKIEQADLIPVTNAVLDVLKDYHMPAEQAATATSQLVKAISFGRVDLTSFSKALANIVPLGAAVGLKFGDVAGALAMMTNHGMTAQRASQNLANAVRSLEGPTTQTKNAWAEFGITAQQVSDSMGKQGLTATLEMLAEAAKKSAAAHGETFAGALKKLAGTAPGLVAALMTTGKYYDESKAAIDGINNASTEAGGHVEGWARVQKTLNQQLSEFVGSVESLAIQLGQMLLPPLTTAFTFLNEHQDVLITIAGIIGGLMVAAFGAWAVSVIAATWPILAIIAVLAGLVFGIKYAYEHSQMFRDIVQEIAKVALPALKFGFDTIKSAFESLANSGIPWLNILKAVGIAIGILVGMIVVNVVSSFVAFGLAIRAVVEILKLLWAAFKATVLGILDLFGAIINGSAAAFGWIPGLGPKLKGAAADFNKFRDSVNNALSGIVDRQVHVNAVVTVNGSAITSYSSGVVSMRSASGGGPTNKGFAFGGVVGAIMGAASGGARNGLIEVGEHGRELVRVPSGSQVMTKTDSDRYMRESTSTSSTQKVAVEYIGDAAALAFIRRIVRIYGRGNTQTAFGS